MRKLGAVLLLVMAPTVWAENKNETQHGDWVSAVGEDGGTFLRAYTTEMTDDSVFLTMDLIPGSCDNFDFNINVTVAEKAKEMKQSEIMLGEMRVDDNPVRAFTFKFTTDPGDPVIYLAPQDWTGGEDLLAEFANGKILRIKVGEDTIMKFSLKGAGEAFKAVTELCNKGEEGSKTTSDQPASSKDDKKYF